MIDSGEGSIIRRRFFRGKLTLVGFGPMSCTCGEPIRLPPLGVTIQGASVATFEEHAPWNGLDFFHEQAFALLPEAWWRKFLLAKRIMTNEPQAIEVEVVEIDGAAPPAKVEHQEQAPQQWQNWQGRIRKLDSRWWPLWVLLGAIGVVLLLTVGLVIGIVFVIVQILGTILRAIFR